MVEVPGRARNQFLPDIDRISVIAAMFMLAYLFTRLVSIPMREFSVQLPGLYLSVQLDVHVFVAILVGGLTAAGTDWLLHDHPALKGRALPYVILPALTALVIGLPLRQLSFGLTWWLGLAIGVSLLVLVLIGEYVSVNVQDLRQPLAAAGLTAVAFALYLILASSLRTAGTRLFLTLPALAIGGWLVSIRVLHLRLHGQWLIYESAVIALIIGQFTTALYYWPLLPLTFGILILGPTYALISLFIGLIEEKPLRQALVEPGLAILIALGIAFWIR
jgi:hypothetical protein